MIWKVEEPGSGAAGQRRGRCSSAQGRSSSWWRPPCLIASLPPGAPPSHLYDRIIVWSHFTRALHKRYDRAGSRTLFLTLLEVSSLGDVHLVLVILMIPGDPGVQDICNLEEESPG
jgi:hypothetical protein